MTCPTCGGTLQPCGHSFSGEPQHICDGPDGCFAVWAGEDRWSLSVVMPANKRRIRARQYTDAAIAASSSHATSRSVIPTVRL